MTLSEVSHGAWEFYAMNQDLILGKDCLAKTRAQIEKSVLLF